MVYSFFRHKIMYHVLFCIYVWYDMCTDLTNLYCNSTTQSVQYLSAPYHMCIIYVRWLSGADMYLTQDCFSHMRRHTPSGSLPPSPYSPVTQIHGIHRIDLLITISVVTSIMADKIQKAVKSLLCVVYILGTKFFSQKCRLRTNKFMIENLEKIIFNC